jgi:paraquat-inducible protein A
MLATILLLVGLSAPILTISQFIFIRNTFSVVSGIYELFRHGQIVLFVLITFFSVILPLLKLWVLFRVLIDRQSHPSVVKRYLHLMHDYGRWSMLDVLVVAMLIVMVKLGTIATVQVHYGLYVFGAAVLLIMYITSRVIRLMTAD